MYVLVLVLTCLLYNPRVGLAYHQQWTGESIIEHSMIFFKFLRAGKAPLLMKLGFKWLRFIMNKSVIYSQMRVLKKDILYLCRLFSFILPAKF